MVYGISYKTFMGVITLLISFDKVDGFFKVYDGTRYLVSFGPERYDNIYDEIRYLISHKSGIKHSIDHNFARVNIDSYNFLPIEKTLPFHNVIIFITSVFSKNQNHYYYNIFLVWGSYEDKPCTQLFWMNDCTLYMLYFDRIDVSEGIDVNKTSESKECNICHYWYIF